ncbi:unnamed protein product [Caenorhabditis auriculariae]|uniref:Uncharacterized protein n=1 Tax=Caenorhabditis auriculariae TaxID=2777116 RepID=A0A8S1GQK4_9PELO|nr:unnamed protein product [Caenorhabditis auriculariae]
MAATASPQQTPNVPHHNAWESAREFFRFSMPTNIFPKESEKKLATPSLHLKPAAAVNADSFYMYACGSINMP